MGAIIFVGDLHYIVKHGFDFNDVAGLTDQDGPIDWPTGERPTLTYFPAFTFAGIFWLPAVATYVWQRRVGKSLAVLIRGGTESHRD